MSAPPVVRYRMTGGPAYLLAWGQRPDGTWWALLVWLEVDADGGFKGSRAWADASDVQRLQGQDYGGVPKKKIHPHPDDGKRRDRFDPRDPGRMSRAEARRRIDAATPREEPPNF